MTKETQFPPQSPIILKRSWHRPGSTALIWGRLAVPVPRPGESSLRQTAWAYTGPLTSPSHGTTPKARAPRLSSKAPSVSPSDPGGREAEKVRPGLAGVGSRRPAEMLRVDVMCQKAGFRGHLLTSGVHPSTACLPFSTNSRAVLGWIVSFQVCGK